MKKRELQKAQNGFQDMENLLKRRNFAEMANPVEKEDDFSKREMRKNYLNWLILLYRVNLTLLSTLIKLQIVVIFRCELK